MRDIEFCKIAKPFLKGKFYLGDLSKGVDCLNSMAAMIDSLGGNFPRQFRDWTEQNYAERWERGEGMDVFKEFLLSLGEPVDINYIRSGDIIIFESDGVVGTGIYLNQGNVRIVSAEPGAKNGVKVFPLRRLKSVVIGVRRLLK